MTVRVIEIWAQPSINAPARIVARKEHRAARAMMRQAIADFARQGVALRVATERRIVTEYGETLSLGRD